MKTQAKQYKYNGQLFTAQEIADYTKTHVTTIYLRLKDYKRDPKAFPMSYVFNGTGHTGTPWSTIRQRVRVLRESGEPEAFAYDNSAWNNRKIEDISKLRKEKKLSQKSLANACGVSQFTISCMERDPNYGSNSTRKKVKIGIAKLVKVSNAQAVTKDELPVNKITKENLRVLLEALLKSL